MKDVFQYEFKDRIDPSKGKKLFPNYLNIAHIFYNHPAGIWNVLTFVVVILGVTKVKNGIAYLFVDLQNLFLHF